MQPANQGNIGAMRKHHKCVKCMETGHTQLYCPKAICEFCGESGHTTQKCLQRTEFHEFILALPYGVRAQMFVSETCRRNDPDVLANMPDMEGVRPRTIQGNAIETRGAKLRIQYGRQSTIAIALRSTDDAELSETLIVIRPNAVRIGMKYSIVGLELREATNKSSTGSKVQASPGANIHILLQADDMFGHTLLLTLGDEKYFIEFDDFRENGMVRQGVSVTSYYQYMFRAWNGDRAMICDVPGHFDGRRLAPVLPVPATQLIQPKAEPIVISDDEDSKAGACSIKEEATLATPRLSPPVSPAKRHEFSEKDDDTADNQHQKPVFRPYEPIVRNFTGRGRVKYANFPLPSSGDSDSDEGQLRIDEVAAESASDSNYSVHGATQPVDEAGEHH